MLSTRSKSRLKPNPDTSSFQYSFEAIGTQWTIETFETNIKGWDNLQNAVARVINDFDLIYSRFRDDSLVTAIAKKAGTYAFPPNAEALFEIYRKLYKLTDGKFTPLIGRTLSDAGYDAAYSLKPQALVRKPQTWDQTMRYKKGALTTTQPVLLDFGAAGKGYLVDLVADALQEHGISEFCINAGGDMKHGTAQASVLPVALEHPDDSTKAIGIAQLDGGALCGSAGNRRTWEDYHHIIDPETVQSPRHIRAVWVISENALVADALTTALYFSEPQFLKQHFDFEYAIITADGGLRSSPGFAASFFTSET